MKKDKLDFQTVPFTFSNNSTGSLTVPNSENRFPVVILLHGFASHKDEVGDFFSLLSQSLATSGIASLRFTFNNFELPEDALINSTIDEMIEETQSAFTALSSIPEINPNRIGLLGFSLGGAVAVLSAAQHPSRCKSLVTWSCAADLDASFRSHVGSTLFERALAGEDLLLDLGWRKIHLGSSFFKSLILHDPLEMIKSYNNPFLAIAGSEDYLAVYLEQFFLNTPSTSKEKVMVEGADHIFNIIDSPDKFAPLVIEKTTSWFKATL